MTEAYNVYILLNKKPHMITAEGSCLSGVISVCNFISVVTETTERLNKQDEGEYKEKNGKNAPLT